MSLVLIFFCGAAQADRLEEILALEQFNTPSLIVDLMDSEQPDAATNPGEWMRWEIQRISMLMAARQWGDVIVRVARIPPNMPRPFVHMAQTQAVLAEIEQGTGEAARKRLTQLIWSGGAEDVLLAQWRRLIVRAYMVEGRWEDASVSVSRYQQDYPEDASPDWLFLKGQVLLGAGRSAEAMAVLEKVNDSQALPMLMLAKLRAGKAPPEEIIADVRKNASEGGAPLYKAYLWMVMAEAAGRISDDVQRIRGMERALASRTSLFSHDPWLTVTADSLWEAYSAYGRTLFLRTGAALDAPATWVDVRKLAAKTLVDGRALYAFIALTARKPEARTLAHQGFLDAVVKEEDEAALLRALYMESHQYMPVAEMPEVARRRLVIVAVARQEYKLAAMLIAPLRAPHPGEDALNWQLRRARVLVLGGEDKLGADALRSVLDIPGALRNEQLDAWLQVVFDLQAAAHHDVAAELFSAAITRVRDVQRRRELQFWKADSLRALGRNQEAAALYLQSALAGKDAVDDAWAYTARYHAAQALSDAGLRDDARRMYESLLAVTTDNQRRTLLQRQLERLSLPK